MLIITSCYSFFVAYVNKHSIVKLRATIAFAKYRICNRLVSVLHHEKELCERGNFHMAIKIKVKM